MAATAEDLALFDEESPAKPAPSHGGAGAEDLAMFADDPTGGRPKGFAGSGGAGPGSVDPDAQPVTELPKVGLDRFSAHPKAMTDTERKAALDRGATASHTDDPGVQAIVGGIAGGGAGKVIGAGARALGLTRTAPVLSAATTGGTASKVQGGDFTTGALVGGVVGAAPLVGRGLTRAAEASAGALRSVGEASIERSAARGATPLGNIAGAVKKTVGKSIEHGHASIPGAIERGAVVSADEAVAAFARKIMGRKGAVASEGAAASEVPAVLSDNPNIRQLQEARPTANAEERDIIDKAIAGYEARAAAPPRSIRPPAPEPTGPATPGDVASRVEGLRSEPLKPAEATATPAPVEAPKAAEFGGRPSNTGPAPTWKPGPDDAKFAKPLGLSVERYREIMAKRTAATLSGGAALAVPALASADDTKKPAPYQRAVAKMADIAKKAPTVERFTSAASAAGLPADAARRVWVAAHKGKHGAPGLVDKFRVEGGQGLIEPGNVDLTNRPDVANADGSHSSVRSMSFEENGREILVPTVSEDGRIMTDDEAIEQYHKTGRHLGKFKTPDAATAYADRLHRQQAGAMHL